MTPKMRWRLAVSAAGLAAIVMGFGVQVSFASAPASTGAETRPSIGGWPEDVDGDGMISDAGEERIPELIKAVGDNGIEGYVRFEDLEGPEPASPAEALAISGKEQIIPVYAADAVTIVDQYTISSRPGSTETASLAD